MLVRLVVVISLGLVAAAHADPLDKPAFTAAPKDLLAAAQAAPRVIGPDGQVTELDQKLVTDAPATNTSPTVFSDQRRMQAPLPRLRIGAVVEEELIVKDRQAILPGVGARLVPVGEGVAVLSTPSSRTKSRRSPHMRSRSAASSSWA